MVSRTNNKLKYEIIIKITGLMQRAICNDQYFKFIGNPRIPRGEGSGYSALKY